MLDQVEATQEALDLIEDIKKDYGEVLFHQSGGCCDGSSPMCFPRSEFRVGSRDIYLGNISSQPFFMSEDQFEYWKHTQ